MLETAIIRNLTNQLMTLLIAIIKKNRRILRENLKLKSGEVVIHRQLSPIMKNFTKESNKYSKNDKVLSLV
jgi:hypothetical protein